LSLNAAKIRIFDLSSGEAVMTALMQAVQRNDAARVRELISQGVDVSQLDENQDAPLIMAAYKGYTDIVRLLLEAGADVSAVDPGMKATALHAAAYAGRAGAARLLIEYGIDIDKQGPYNGYTALHDAVWQNNIDVAEILINAGANLNIKSHSGETPLEFARAKKHHKIVALIEQKIAEQGRNE
jgi:ankyrin repeat protein